MIYNGISSISSIGAGQKKDFRIKKMFFQYQDNSGEYIPKSIISSIETG